MSENRALVPGEARGIAVILEEPLSFWGGVDPQTGVIIDRHHPQVGTTITGTILVMPSGRGSSSSSSVLAEAIRVGTAPAAIVLKEPDRILALGALVAAELYGTLCPVVVAAEDVYGAIRPGEVLGVEQGEGRWEIRPATLKDGSPVGEDAMTAHRVRGRPAAALERARSVLGWIARGTARLAIVALVAAAVIWWATVGADRTPLGTQLVVAALLLLPPGILFLFVVALRTLMSVPDRIRQAPTATRERVEEVRARLRELGAPGRRGVVARLRSLLRLLWAIVSSRELLEVVGPTAVLLTPGMLAAAVLAAVGALVEILAGVVALLWLGLS